MTTNQDQKIESFFCKPATYEEAVEICEMAVANGADKYEWPRPYEEGDYRDRTYPLSELPLWGVKDDVTFCASLEEYFGDDAKELTIQQVRERYQLPHETNQDQTIHVTENKQEFVPSVGQECILVSMGFCDYNTKVLITYLGDGVGCYKRISDGMEFTFSATETVFKPLKTEADTRREDAINQMIDCVNLGWRMDANIDCMKAHEMTCEQLHDAGYIKPRELTTEQIKNAAEYANSKCSASVMSVLSFIKGARWAEKHIKGES